jgi:tRNA-splicing ligase RtcB (3'-phosphate/5'-hydroxy nucleic acid ligase)
VVGVIHELPLPLHFYLSSIDSTASSPIRMTYQQLDINTPKPVLSWAGHDLAQAETKMAKNVASLPFVFKHVALMPDVHLGKGALVGSVIATTDAIIPAAVGVDIGCFTGDTLIPLVDGKDYPIKELAQKNAEFIVYACTPTGKIVAAIATAKLTRENTSLVKVILDNGKEIICTPDHQFMLRDGTYQAAIDLKHQTSLMPFYSKLDREGYTLIAQPYSGRWHKAHWIIARSGILGDIPRFERQRTIIHHRNFSQSDNRPDNLEFMGDRDHSAYHRSLVDRNQHWQSPDFEQRRVAAIAQKAQTSAGRAYFAQRGTANILKYMVENPAHFQKSVAGNGERGKCYLVTYNQSERGRVKSKEIANRLDACDICGSEIKSPIGLHNHRKKEHQCNHKVAAVIPLNRTEDVYCLTVPEYHNFALSAGIFVHNCGMMAIQTPFKGEKLEGKLKKIRLDLEAQIPVGFEENKEISKDATNWQGWQDFDQLHRGVRGLENKAIKQLGSLGGGNHFIEVCIDTEDKVWLMLHSGSRNIGNKLAQCHIDTAKDLAKLADLSLPDRDLAYFVAGTPEFAAYWRDLQWAQNYARTNRDVMMSRFMRVMERHLNGGKKMKPLLSVNCHHNYAEKEVHFGAEVYVTRKGAVRAQKEDYGIIPGSMGTKSYIVKGKGNVHSFCSCSHGAGRIMSRSMAKNTYTLDDLIAQTKGVECRKDTELLDEIPAAYKSIDTVMANQSDLVEVVATLKQVVCIKG